MFERVFLEMFCLKKLNGKGGTESNCCEISNVCGVLVDFKAELGINCAAETFRGDISISAQERKHKPGFDKGCSKLLDQRK
jgi:hypothetical protein